MTEDEELMAKISQLAGKLPHDYRLIPYPKLIHSRPDQQAQKPSTSGTCTSS
jgi:hypothetical protein